MIDLEQFKSQAAKKKPENRKFLAGLKKKDPRKVDAAFHALHSVVFGETNCLECANCCKTTSPIFYRNDIERAARALKMRPGDFVLKVAHKAVGTREALFTVVGEEAEPGKALLLRIGRPPSEDEESKFIKIPDDFKP